MTYDRFDGPLGPMIIEMDQNNLKALFISHDDYELTETKASIHIKKQLEAYFLGQLKTFDVPMVIKASPFYERVYDVLAKIPYGQTKSYQEVAFLAGNIKASRAVGMAMHKNPIMIICPCHRVIGKNNQLTGFALGLDMKAWLLSFEKKNMV